MNNNQYDENESLSSEKRYGAFGGGRVREADGDAGGIPVVKYNLILGGVLLTIPPECGILLWNVWKIPTQYPKRRYENGNLQQENR